MIKMRALSGFSTTVHGNIGAGDMFVATSEEYAKMLTDNNLAEIMVDPAVKFDEVEEPKPKRRRGRRRK